MVATRLCLVATLALGGCHWFYPHGPAALPEAGAADRAGTDRVAERSVDRLSGDRPSDAAAGWLPGWGYRRLLVLAPQGEDLSSFPVLVAIQNDGGLVQHALPNGGDLAFTAGDGTSQLAHELEVADVKDLVAWVKVPVLTAQTTTELYLYYGNPSAPPPPSPAAVWSNGFLAVWHFHTAPPTLSDSAGGSSGSTQNMSAGDRVTGQIGQAYQFNGVNQRVIVNSQAVRPSGAFQVSTWYRAGTDAVWDDDVLVGVMGDDTFRGWDLSVSAEAPPDPCRYTMFRSSADGKLTKQVGWGRACPGEWHFVVGAFLPGTELRFQLDDALPSLLPTTATKQHVPDPSKVPLVIAAESMGTLAYTAGLLDEMRLEVPRSQGWIAACYSNQIDPQGFVSVGKEESR